MTTQIEVTSQSKEAEVDQSLVKVILLGLFGVGLSLLTTAFFVGFLGTLLPADFLLWFITASAFLIIASLQMVFIKNDKRLAFFMFLNGIAPLGFFWAELYPNPSMPILFGGVLFAVFLMIGAGRGWSILAEGITVRFALAVRNMLPKAVTGMLIFLCVAAYVSYFKMNQFTVVAEKNLFEAALVYAEPAVHLWFPSVSFNDAPADFFKKVAASEIASIPTSELSNINEGKTLSFNSLPPAVKDRLIAEAATRVQQAFESKYGKINSGETMKDVFFRLAEYYAGQASASMGTAFGVSIAVLLFFILRGFFSLVLWLLALLSFLVYKFLIITGFAYVSVESRSREFVILS